MRVKDWHKMHPQSQAVCTLTVAQQQHVLRCARTALYHTDSKTNAGRLCDDATKAALCTAADTARAESVAAITHAARPGGFQNQTGKERTPSLHTRQLPHSSCGAAMALSTTCISFAARHIIERQLCMPGCNATVLNDAALHRMRCVLPRLPVQASGMHLDRALN